MLGANREDVQNYDDGNGLPLVLASLTDRGAIFHGSAAVSKMRTKTRTWLVGPVLTQRTIKARPSLLQP